MRIVSTIYRCDLHESSDCKGNMTKNDYSLQLLGPRKILPRGLHVCEPCAIWLVEKYLPEAES
jgi:hypothetical protein